MKNFLKPVVVITSALLIISCGENQSNQDTSVADTSLTIQHPKTKALSEDEPRAHDTIAVKILTKEIFTSLKNKEYESFANYIHPDSGVRFSPYAHIDKAKDVTLNPEELLQGIKENKIFSWGNAAGSGEAIKLSIPDYLEKFVYNVDFLNAEKTAVNKIIRSGNSVNNLEEIYSNALFTESYDAGNHEMAWSVVRLVFKEEAGKLYLSGIVHDQWTP